MNLNSHIFCSFLHFKEVLLYSFIFSYFYLIIILYPFTNKLRHVTFITFFPILFLNSFILFLKMGGVGGLPEPVDVLTIKLLTINAFTEASTVKNATVLVFCGRIASN